MITPGRKKTLTLQEGAEIEKKIRILIQTNFRKI